MNRINILRDLHHFFERMVQLCRTPVFISLTVLGNGLIGLSGLILYGLERNQNPHIRSYVDTLWWAFSTATSTGYGDVTPVTGPGKILGIFLMLMGTALFAIYTALFAQAILSSERFRG